MSENKKFIIPCNQETFPLLKEFTIPYEPFCVELCTHFNQGFEHFFLITNTENPSSTKQIIGVFHLTRSFLFCFRDFKTDFPTKEDFMSVFKDFMHYFKQKYIKVIIGEHDVCSFFLEIFKDLNIQSEQINQYKLLTLEDEPFSPPEQLSCDDFIKCCTQDDFDDLFPLQKNFLIKEVALKNHQVTDQECSVMLSNMLKNQLVMALCSDSLLVAKANTNAIGPHWIQLGGIFTQPLYRHNYYAWHLIYALSLRIQKNRKKVCLFVKERNTPACTLYQRIGFTQRGNLTIIYF